MLDPKKLEDIGIKMNALLDRLGRSVRDGE